MQAGSPRSTSSPTSADEVRAQVERIRKSTIFEKSERLGRFLSFVVEESLASRGETLKEPVIASAVYPIHSGSDPVVRVEARRLRDKLREYYTEFPGERIEITLPKGSYMPRFAARGIVTEPAPAAVEQSSTRSPVRRWIALITVVAVAVLVVFAVNRSYRPDVEFTPVPLTSYPGVEDGPSLSPDGNFVAFAWTGRGGGPRHIYVKAVGGDAIRQLTEGSTGEHSPAFSPDGQHIAFVRNPRGVYVMSALGGSELLISAVGSYAAWTADSKALLIREPGPNGPHGIVEISLATMERRQVTQAPIGDGDWRFEVSPDGKTLAFIRYDRSGVSDLYRVATYGGQPTRVTNWNKSLIGVAWTPDGRELVYSVREDTGMRLWRIAANVGSPSRGTRVRGTASNAGRPSISRPSSPRAAVRLALEFSLADVGLRLVDLMGKSEEGVFKTVERIVDSTRSEQPGRWSADGQWLAFASDRDGEIAIWICRRDGSGLFKLALQDGTMAWSSDGKQMAFDAVENGNTDLYVISMHGGQPRRLTSEPGIDGAAEWSRDGQWIYFSSTRAGGKMQLWRMPAAGGPAVQITKHGGFRPRESPDGRYLYYVDRLPSGLNGRGRLMRVPVEGGEEIQVLEEIGGWTWDLADSGIVFLVSADSADFVDLLRHNDHKTVRLGRLPFRPARVAVGWAVSRDGRWLLTNQVDRLDSDLMLIDNFR